MEQLYNLKLICTNCCTRRMAIFLPIVTRRRNRGCLQRCYSSCRQMEDLRVHVRHGGITKTFDFSLNSASHAAYAVFYADCEHELQRITNGKWLCPAFNLMRGRNVSFDMQPKELKEFSSRLRKVEEALSLWRESLIITGARVARVQRGKKNKLAIPLKHRYTKANLSFSGLKGKDRMVAHVLANCRDAGRPWLDMHLCILTLYMKGVAEENNYKRRRLELDSESDDLIDTSNTTADLCVEESFTCSDWGEKIRNRQTVNYADDRIDDCHRMIDAKRPKITCNNWVDIHNMRCGSQQGSSRIRKLCMTMRSKGHVMMKKVQDLTKLNLNYVGTFVVQFCSGGTILQCL